MDQLTLSFTLAAFFAIFVNFFSELKLSRVSDKVSAQFKGKYGALDRVRFNEYRSFKTDEVTYVTWDSFRMAALVVSVVSSIGSLICFLVLEVPALAMPTVVGAIVVGVVGVLVVGWLAVKLLVPLRWLRALFI